MGGLIFTSSQMPVEAPQERPKHSLTDNTIPDNEHARKDAIVQLERTRVEVAVQIAEEARKEKAKKQELIAQKKAEEARKAEKARQVASVRAKESAITSTKQVKHTHATPKTQEKEKKRVVVSRSSGKAQAPTKTFEATFYTAYCDTGCKGVTATGIDVRETIYSKGLRVIAVDPSVIPLRSLVRVTLADGTSFNAVAGDTGGAIKGYKIDILVGSKDEARKLGRQKVTVKILN